MLTTRPARPQTASMTTYRLRQQAQAVRSEVVNKAMLIENAHKQQQQKEAHVTKELKDAEQQLTHVQSNVKSLRCENATMVEEVKIGQSTAEQIKRVVDRTRDKARDLSRRLELVKAQLKEIRAAHKDQVQDHREAMRVTKAVVERTVELKKTNDAARAQQTGSAQRLGELNAKHAEHRESCAATKQQLEKEQQGRDLQRVTLQAKQAAGQQVSASLNFKRAALTEALDAKKQKEAAIAELRERNEASEKQFEGQPSVEELRKAIADSNASKEQVRRKVEEALAPQRGARELIEQRKADGNQLKVQLRERYLKRTMATMVSRDAVRDRSFAVRAELAAARKAGDEKQSAECALSESRAQTEASCAELIARVAQFERHAHDKASAAQSAAAAAVAAAAACNVKTQTMDMILKAWREAESKNNSVREHLQAQEAQHQEQQQQQAKGEEQSAATVARCSKVLDNDKKRSAKKMGEMDARKAALQHEIECATSSVDDFRRANAAEQHRLEHDDSSSTNSDGDDESDASATFDESDGERDGGPRVLHGSTGRNDSGSPSKTDGDSFERPSIRSATPARAFASKSASDSESDAASEAASAVSFRSEIDIFGEF
eukprot:g4863.t1